MKVKLLGYFFLLTVLSGCSGLLYQPSREKYFDPSKTSNAPTDYFIDSTDGVKLHLWHFKTTQKKPKAILVFFHGNAENISTHFANLFWILKHGYDYVIFDYRGYGMSTGEPSPKGTVDDGKAVVRWVQKKFPQTPMVVFAESLGGAVGLKTVIDLKVELPFAAVVADSTFLSYEKIGADVLSRTWITWIFQPLAYLLLSDKWAPGDDVVKVAPIPLLVMHGTEDRVVPIKLGKELYEKAGQPKEFWEITNGAHIDAFAAHKNKYRDKFLDYLKKTIR